MTPEARDVLATNADLLSSDLVEGEGLNRRKSTIARRRMSTRLAPSRRRRRPPWSSWSIYRGTTAEEMKSAVRVEWSSRPLDASRVEHTTDAVRA